MLSVLTTFLATAREVLRPRADLVLEIATPREQLGVLSAYVRPGRRLADDVVA